MWDVTWPALVVLIWVAPWHVRVLSLFRLRWSDRVDVGVSVVLFVGNSTGVILGLLRHSADGAVAGSATCAASIGYALWRAWREHKPPRRRLRDRVSELGKKLSERIALTPVRVPLPIGA